MLIERSIDANLIVYVDVIVNQAEYQYEVYRYLTLFSCYKLMCENERCYRERTVPAPQQRSDKPSDPQVVRKAAYLKGKRISIRGRLQQDQIPTQTAA